MNLPRRFDVVGLFPPIGPEALGGIEAVGRMAWSEVVATADGPTFLVSYGPGQDERRDGSGLATASRSRAALAAATLTLRARRALVWHLGLSPLLPLLRPLRNGAAVYLHGIEAWRPIPLHQKAALLATQPLLIAHVQMTVDRFLAANPWAQALRTQVVAPGTGRPLEAGTPPPSPPPAVVMISRLRRDEAYKGHREVIEAWPAVGSAMPDAELWIIGDGDLRPDLESLAARLGLHDRVHFLGRLDDADRDGRIVAARCLALPSRGEGFGLVYLEAMRQGRPCLVSNLDSGQFVVNPPECGLAVDPSDSGSMAAALVRLMTPGAEWNEWSRAARCRYESNFTEEAFRKRFLDTWRRVG